MIKISFLFGMFVIIGCKGITDLKKNNSIYKYCHFSVFCNELTLDTDTGMKIIPSEYDFNIGKYVDDSSLISVYIRFENCSGGYSFERKNEKLKTHELGYYKETKYPRIDSIFYFDYDIMDYIITTDTVFFPLKTGKWMYMKNSDTIKIEEYENDILIKTKFFKLH